MRMAINKKLQYTLLTLILSGLTLSVPSANRKVFVKKRRSADVVKSSVAKSDTIYRMNVYSGKTVSDTIRIHGVPCLQVDSTMVTDGGNLRLSADDDILISGDTEVEIGGELLVRSSGQNRIRFIYNDIGFRSSKRVDTSTQ